MQENEARRIRLYRLYTVLYRVTAVMLCATLVSCYMVAGLWARYTTRGEFGEGSRVAVFRVDAGRKTGESGNLTQHLTGEKTGDVTTYNMVITNTSEVAVNCKVSVRFSSAVAGYFAAVLSQNGTAFTATSLSADNTTRTWTAGSIAPGGSVTYQLDLQMLPSSANSVALDESGTNYTFDTFVMFEQVD